MKKILLIITISLLVGSAVTLFAQNENYLKNRIMVEGLYIRNLGHFSEVWSNAAGGYAGYGIAFPDHNLLMIRTGYIKNNLRDGVNYQDASSVIIPLEIGGRYYFVDHRFMPFVLFMNGLNFVIENTSLEGDKRDKTLVKYTWLVGFGLTINLISNLNLDVGVNYQSNFYTTEAMNTGFKYVFGFGYAIGN